MIKLKLRLLLGLLLLGGWLRASEPIWEFPLGGQGQENWPALVEAALAAAEASGLELGPGERGKVGLKLFTSSGSGIATPKAMVLALIHALERRGFARENIVLFDVSERKLRQAGFLPPLSERRRDFHGAPVHALEKGAYYHEVWYYDSPLPSRLSDLGGEAGKTVEVSGEARRSYLPIPLLMEFDYWINLPMGMHEPALGVSATLANASLFNASNATRFLANPATAPVAVAEIGAVPELLEGWRLNLLCLRPYQYLGGPRYNARYTAKDAVLLASADPVALDYLLYERMEAARVAAGFEADAARPLLFDYCETIGLGHWRDTAQRLRRSAAIGAK